MAATAANAIEEHPQHGSRLGKGFAETDYLFPKVSNAPSPLL